MGESVARGGLFLYQGGYIGSSWMGYDSESQTFAGANGNGTYYTSITKIRTPAFSGTSKNITLSMYIVANIGSNPTLRYALCTSDVNGDYYTNTYNAVSDGTQIASGRVTLNGIFAGANSYVDISIDTGRLEGNKEYFLYLWSDTPPSNPQLVVLQGSNYHRSIAVTYYEPFSLSISAGTGSTITVARNGSYLSNGASINYGDVLTISFSANNGYTLASHTVNGSYFSSGGTLTVTGDVYVVASASLKSYTLSVSQGSGSWISVTRNGSSLSNGSTIYHGDTLIISFGANTGYNLESHTVNGTTFGSGSSFIVTGDINVASSAKLRTFTLYINQGTGTTITVRRGSSILYNGSSLSYGDVLVISCVGNTGYTLSSHTVNGAAFSSGGSHSVSGDVTVASSANLRSFVLSVGSIAHGSVTVNRTSSLGGSTGNIASGAKIFYFDSLKITFTANNGFKFTTTLVNGAAFSSGGTHTVSGNVSITATTEALCSEVGATDASIGSASVISIVSNNGSYRHTLSYSFGNLQDIIVTKTASTSYPWTIPTSFYNVIPNSKSGTCKITCETFSGNTSLGKTTCTITISTSSSECKPSVSGTVVDTNADTVALTGDKNALIRYKSTAECKISATAKNGASISSLQINGVSVSSPNYSRVFTNVETNVFTFRVVDSRGYSSEYVVKPTWVAYRILTINPIFYRPAPTTGEMALTFNGNYFNGSFGKHKNTIAIRYRYRNVQTESAFGSWITIPSSDFSTGTSTYKTNAPIILDESFTYTQTFEFQIQAYDGAGGVVLTEVHPVQTVQRGKPVFDWGENDFNFNVPVKIDNVNIVDIFYPINTVYLSKNSSLPGTLSSLGTWTSITTGISGVYGWMRSS